MLTLGSFSIARIGLVPGVSSRMSAAPTSWTWRVSPWPKTMISPASAEVPAVSAAVSAAASAARAGCDRNAVEASRMMIERRMVIPLVEFSTAGRIGSRHDGLMEFA